ncbi:MAG: NusG domain II-containing protein [Lachnospiraceae bacterium]|nr:NusG domain II-containing protein [Lachnospiraceae bacterium]
MSLSRDKRYVNDFILIAAALILGVLLVFLGNRKGGGQIATVTDSNGQIYTFNLDENTEFRIETDLGYNIISVKDGNISVSDADCPDCSCVKQGEISKKGEKIVCLPHKLIVEVNSEDNTDLDSITY